MALVLLGQGVLGLLGFTTWVTYVKMDPCTGLGVWYTEKASETWHRQGRKEHRTVKKNWVSNMLHGENNRGLASPRTTQNITHLKTTDQP